MPGSIGHIIIAAVVTTLGVQVLVDDISNSIIAAIAFGTALWHIYQYWKHRRKHKSRSSTKPG